MGIIAFSKKSEIHLLITCFSLFLASYLDYMVKNERKYSNKRISRE
jgi:hypothetical protein